MAIERATGEQAPAMIEAQHNTASQRSAWPEFRTGFVDTLPLWLGVVPFGIAYALAAQAGGLDWLQTLAMSLLVFAGASQFTAAGLFANGVSGLSIILTTLIVNLRHVLLTASLAPALRHLSWLQRAGLAFGVTDESYAVSVQRVVERKAGGALLLGANVSLYVSWQLSTIAGLLLGGILPDPTALGLELVFPLSFLVLLVPYLKSRAAWVAAIVAGIVGLIARLVLPGSWYILIAAITGSIAGAWLEQE